MSSIATPSKPASESLLSSEASLDITVNRMALLDHLNQAQDLQDMSERVMAMINRMGFSEFGHLRLDGGQSSQGVQFLNTFPTEIHDTYYYDEFWRHDVMMQHASRSLEPRFASELTASLEHMGFDSYILDRNREIQRVSRASGHIDHYNTQVKAANGSGHVMLCVASRVTNLESFKQRARRYSIELRELAECVDYVTTLKFPENFIDSAKDFAVAITPAPLELIKLMAERDVNEREASAILGISERATQKRMHAAKKALGVSTVSAAVYQALKRGLI